MNKKQFIKKNMEEKMQWLKENTNHQVAIMFLQGSQNYGMDNYSEEYTSDFDMKCFIVPTLEDLIHNKNGR